MSRAFFEPPTAQTEGSTSLIFCMGSQEVISFGLTEAIFDQWPLSWDMGVPWGTPGGPSGGQKFVFDFLIFCDGTKFLMV